MLFLRKEEESSSLNQKGLLEVMKEELGKEKTTIKESIDLLTRYDLVEKGDEKLSFSDSLWEYRGVLGEIKIRE